MRVQCLGSSHDETARADCSTASLGSNFLVYFTTNCNVIRLASSFSTFIISNKKHLHFIMPDHEPLATETVNEENKRNLDATTNQSFQHGSESGINTTQFTNGPPTSERRLRLASILPPNVTDDEDGRRPLECDIHDFHLDQPPPFLYVENSLSFRSNSNHLRPILLSEIGRAHV